MSINWIVVIFFFGFSVFIHELGHLLAALWRKLHVEKFAVNFGHAIWRKNIRGIDYQVGWIPLGGFVAIPQLDPTDEIKTSKGEELPHAHPIDRILVALAGPVFNVLLALVLGVFVWFYGYTGPEPADSVRVGSVPETYLTKDGETLPTPEFEAGLRPGDIIHKVNGESFKKGFSDMAMRIMTAKDGHVELEVERNGSNRTVTYDVVKNPRFLGAPGPFFDEVYRVEVQGISPDSPAYKAGLKPGDLILTINGTEPLNAGDVTTLVNKTGGKPFDMLISREIPVTDTENAPLNPPREEILIKDVQTRWALIDGENVRQMMGIGMAPYFPMTILKPTPWEQVVEVYDMTARTLRSLIDSNPVDVRDMNGAPMIFKAMKQSFDSGFIQGIKIVVLINLSLAFLNLLPIPVLDGGHITYGIIEMIIRRRVPSKVTIPLQATFAAVLIGFMLFVVGNDFIKISKMGGGSSQGARTVEFLPEGDPRIPASAPAPEHVAPSALPDAAQTETTP